MIKQTGIPVAMLKAEPRMKAYSPDLRMRVVQAIDKKVGTQSEVAELFGVSRSFVKKVLRQRRQTGHLDPRPRSGGHVPIINGETLDLLRKRLTEQPNATLEELRQYLAQQTGVHVSTATLCRARRKLNLPRKKPSWQLTRRVGTRMPDAGPGKGNRGKRSSETNAAEPVRSDGGAEHGSPN